MGRRAGPFLAPRAVITAPSHALLPTPPRSQVAPDNSVLEGLTHTGLEAIFSIFLTRTAAYPKFEERSGAAYAGKLLSDDDSDDDNDDDGGGG